MIIFEVIDSCSSIDKYPSDEGIVPLSKFASKIRYLRFVKNPNDEGICPVNIFSSNERPCSDDNNPSVDGIVPFNLLLVLKQT